MIIEKTLVRNPTVPFEILSHPMSVLGYLCNFVHGTTILAVSESLFTYAPVARAHSKAVYYIPSYYQAVQEKTPIQSGIDLLSLSFVVAPMGIVTGIIITATGRYKWINVFFFLASSHGSSADVRATDRRLDLHGAWPRPDVAHDGRCSRWHLARSVSLHRADSRGEAS